MSGIKKLKKAGTLLENPHMKLLDAGESPIIKRVTSKSNQHRVDALSVELSSMSEE